MSVSGLEQCLFDIGCSGKARRTYVAQPEEFLERYPLEAEERCLVVQADVAELFRRGLNPMLLMGFYMGLHGPRSMPDYLGKMPTLESQLEAVR